MGRELWPLDDEALDHELLRRATWSDLIDRWAYTTRCFIHRVFYDDAHHEKLAAHRLMVIAAHQAWASDLPFERVWSDEVICFVSRAAPEFMGMRAERLDGDEATAARVFCRVSPIDQFVLLLYDHDYRGPSRHDTGLFLPDDLARLWAANTATVTQRARRALARFRDLVDAEKDR